MEESSHPEGREDVPTREEGISSQREEELLKSSGGETETGQDSSAMDITTKEDLWELKRKDKRNRNRTKMRREERAARRESKQLQGEPNPLGEGSQARPTTPEQATPPGRPQNAGESGPSSRYPNTGSQETQGTGEPVRGGSTFKKVRGPIGRQARWVEKRAIRNQPIILPTAPASVRVVAVPGSSRELSGTKQIQTQGQKKLRRDKGILPEWQKKKPRWIQKSSGPAPACAAWVCSS